LFPPGHLKAKGLILLAIKTFGEVQMPRRNQHIIRHPKGWAVQKEGSKKVTAIFDTQEDAIEYGRHLAIQQRSQLVIFNRDGVERERRNYRHPRPQRFYPYNLGLPLSPPPAIEVQIPPHPSENALNN
jgi:Uncharacterized protein conserved in bacteria (DUF2188)